MDTNHTTPSLRPKIDPEKELILSEETYVSELKILVDTFVTPLDTWLSRFQFERGKQYQEGYCLEVIIFQEKVDIVNALFSNIRVILDCNNLLLDSLHESDKKGSVSGEVIAAFHRHAPYLKLYSQYTRNYNKALSLLSRLMSDSRYSSVTDLHPIYLKCGQIFCVHSLC